ncbi:MAG: 2'-5' RNA ligase family protein [Sphingomonas sp.]|nr:2'-5' RNA ligase family protein [Sphingomonas sp.]RZV49594.1 MAG: 2'-5' RNA ligase family protein [Sphingomonadaceae bacterium]
MSGALIVTAALERRVHDRLTGERKAHFPAERNFLDAHLTMFHALPPSCGAEAASLLKRITNDCKPPRARLAEVISLGRGVAYKVESDDLRRIRDVIADHFHGMLTAQDSQGWRPHITIQNKVKPFEAKALLDEKREAFEPQPLDIIGLSLHRYMDGPWEKLGSWRFRGLDIA